MLQLTLSLVTVAWGQGIRAHPLAAFAPTFPLPSPFSLQATAALTGAWWWWWCLFPQPGNFSLAHPVCRGPAGREVPTPLRGDSEKVGAAGECVRGATALFLPPATVADALPKGQACRGYRGAERKGALFSYEEQYFCAIPALQADVKSLFFFAFLRHLSIEACKHGLSFPSGKQSMSLFQLWDQPFEDLLY